MFVGRRVHWAGSCEVKGWWGISSVCVLAVQMRLGGVGLCGCVGSLR